MFASSVIPDLVLTECPDRRARERLAHREPVQINGRPVIGCDISAKGIAVVMRSTVSVGDVVQVSLFRPQGRIGGITRPARVARVEARADRFLVGLEFVR